jgi:hypothetical protein
MQGSRTHGALPQRVTSEGLLAGTEMLGSDEERRFRFGRTALLLPALER